MRERDPGTHDRTTGRRGQSYVLEGIAGGVIVLAAVLFAIQATAVTPLSVSTANKHIENQERFQAEGVLDEASRDGTLEDAILYWNPDNRTFVDGSTSGYDGDIRDPAPNEFLAMVNRTFSDEQIAVNIYVTFTNNANRTGTQRLLYQGTPSDNAVSANTMIVLYDDDRFSAPETNGTLADDPNAFYAPDAAPNASVYNVMEVRVVLWRM